MDAPWCEPESKREGDDFLYLWRPMRVGVALTNVRVDDDGRVHAEISVMTIDAAGKRTGLLEWGGLNLSSLSGRESLERALRKRTDGDPLLHWGKALLWVCSRASAAYREGGPVVDLAQGTAGATTRFAFDRFLPLGEVSTLYADGSGGKSLTAMLFCLSFATGEPVAGVLRPTLKGPALYLDWETTEDEQKARLDCLARGFGLRARPTVLYRAMQRPLAEDAAAVRKLVDQHGVGFVVVDSQGLACGNVLDQEKVMRFYGALRSLPTHVTKLVLTHLSAEGAKQETGTASPVGLRWVWNLGRSNWELRADRNDAAGYVEVAMYHRKVNGVGFPLQRPLGLRYSFDPIDGAVGVEQFDVLGNATLVAHSGAGDRILALLREGPATTQQLAEGTGLRSNVVRVHLSRLSKTRIVTHVNGSTHSPWTLVEMPA